LRAEAESFGRAQGDYGSAALTTDPRRVVIIFEVGGDLGELEEGGFEVWGGIWRTLGKAARVYFRSKVKRREWSNFGVERRLGAANGDGRNSRREEFTGWKAIP